MGTAPSSGGEDDLDLLTARETAHRVVGRELGLKTEVGEVRLDLLADEGTEETGLLRLARVDLLDLEGEEGRGSS